MINNLLRNTFCSKSILAMIFLGKFHFHVKGTKKSYGHHTWTKYFTTLKDTKQYNINTLTNV